MATRLFCCGLLTATLGAVTIHRTFEGASLGSVYRVKEHHYRLAVQGQADQQGRNRQANWYYFRVEAAEPGVPLRLDMVNLPGEYNFKPNRGAVTQDTPPVLSYDEKNWEHVTTFEYDPAEPKLILHVTPKKPVFWIAHTPPYTNRHLERLRSQARRHPAFREQIIGHTVEQRPIYLWTIASGTPKHTVWLMFRQHSWESGSSWAGEGAIHALLSSRTLTSAVAWKIFPMCDPDGVLHGGVRFNRHGFDLNRNWDVENPAQMPEITAQRRAVTDHLKAGRAIDLFFTLHNTETSEYLEGPPEQGGKGRHTALAQRLFEILTAKTTFAPTRELFYSEDSTTAGMAGRMTAPQGLYRLHGIAAFTMEQRISFNPKLNRLPTAQDRLTFGKQLVEAIFEAVTSPAPNTRP